MSKEIRSYEATECRAVGGSGDADPLRIEGYAATFGVYSRDLGGFREKIKPGAFNRVISEKQDVRCLFNHDASQILGRTSAGTLQIWQDARGLGYRCTLPNTQAARDLHTSIARGDISQCSFSFTVAKNGQNWTDSTDTEGRAFPSRELTDVDVYDVSPVVYPAYERGTEVTARAMGVDIPKDILAAVEKRNADLQKETQMAAENRNNGTCIAELQIPGSWRQEVKDAAKAAFDAAFAKAREAGEKNNIAYTHAAAEAYKAISGMLTEGEIEAGTSLEKKRTEVDTSDANAVQAAKERAAALEAEERKKNAPGADDDDDDDEDADLSDLDTEFDEDDMEDRGEVDPAKLHANHTADGDCAEGECGCQNRFGFDKNKRAWDPKAAGDVASKIRNHTNKAAVHDNIASTSENQEVRDMHTKAAGMHAAAAEAHAGLAGQTKEVAEKATDDANGATGEAVRCSMRCSQANMKEARGKFNAAAEDVVGAHANHSDAGTDMTAEKLDEAHKAHAVEARKFSPIKRKEDDNQARVSVLTAGDETANAKEASPAVLPRNSKLTKEVRGVTTRTKHVAGKDYPASAFETVGDKDDTATWKGLKTSKPVAADDKQRSDASEKERRAMLAEFLETMGPDAEVPAELLEERGGPGSGRHPGEGAKTEAQHNPGEGAKTEAQHNAAAAAHMRLADKAEKAGDKFMAGLHREAATFHAQAASAHTEEASGKARDASAVANIKDFMNHINAAQALSAKANEK